MKASNRDVKEQKRRDAEARNAKWAALPLTEQVAHLDKVFGPGLGAAKQRAKIAARMKIVEVASAKKATTKKDKKVK